MAKELDLHYQPSDVDYEINPSLFGHYPNKPTFFNTKNMPLLPLDPAVVKDKVVELLNLYGNVVSTPMQEQIIELCKLFNYSIECNQSDFHRMFVYAAQTGISKSLSLQTYISMLETHSSLVIVSKVDEAIAYCKFINEQSSDDNYARCYYALSNKNTSSNLRVNTYELKNHRCIVISHAMFKRISQQDDSIDEYRLFNGNQRDLVVIDEKIPLYEKTLFSKKELTNLLDKIFLICNELDIKDSIKYTQGLMFLEELVNYHKISGNEVVSTVETIESLIAPIKEAIILSKELFRLYVDYIFDKLKEITDISSDSYKNQIIDSIIELLNRIDIVVNSERIIFYKDSYGEYFLTIHDITNKLGSTVVLDATATVNEYYKVAYRYGSGLVPVGVKPIRKYSNLTINKAKGFTQGRNSLYSNLSSKEVSSNVKMYLSYAYGILSNHDDKLLVIAHKKFMKHLKDECNDKRIVFTNWGNHIGKNEWSDCNKVMIVGWNFLKQIEHVCTACNAIDEMHGKQHRLDKDVIEQFAITQLAEDMIQGIMRSKARIVSTEDTDCSKTDVYMFYEDNKKYNDVIDIVVEHFPKVVVQEWIPTGYTRVVKKTKPNQKADDIINYLEAQEDKKKDVLLVDVIKELNLPKSTASRIINSNYFKDKLIEKNYAYRDINGRSKYFILT